MPSEGEGPPPPKLPQLLSSHERSRDPRGTDLPSLSTLSLPPVTSAGQYQAPQTDHSLFQVGPPTSYESHLRNPQIRRLDNTPFGGSEVPPAGPSRTAPAPGYVSNLSDPQPRRLDDITCGGPKDPPALARERSQYLDSQKAEPDAQVANLRTVEGIYYRYESGITVEEAAKLYNVNQDAVAEYFKELSSEYPAGRKKRKLALQRKAYKERRSKGQGPRDR